MTSSYLHAETKVKFKFKFKVKGRGTRCRTNLQVELRFFFRRQNQRKPRGQVSQYFWWSWPLNLKVKFQVKGRGTSCRPNLKAELRFFSTSKSAQTTWASVAVLSMTLTFDLQGQIQGQRTGNALQTKLTVRIAFFRRQISANHVGKCRSTFDDRDLWPSGSNSRSKDGERAVDQPYRPNCVFQRQNQRKPRGQVSQYFRCRSSDRMHGMIQTEARLFFLWLPYVEISFQH